MQHDLQNRYIESEVEALASQAVAYVSKEIYRRYSNDNALPGAAGRSQTREDLAFQVEFLIGALATGAQPFFSDYIIWLTTALRSRGVPAGVLDEALLMLDEFFREALEPGPGRLVSDVIKSGRRAIVEVGNRVWSNKEDDEGEQLPHTDQLVKSLINGDVQTAQFVANEFWYNCSNYSDIATLLFQPALYKVGYLWQQNQITVDQEHSATTITRFLLLSFFKRSSIATVNPVRSALFSTVPGNTHEIGPQIVADAFRLEGWSVHPVLGDVPVTDLIVKIDQICPEIVGLSVALVEHLPELRRMIYAMKSELGAKTPTILVGGLATNRFKHAWRWVGADAWAPDAKQASKGFT